MLSLIPEIIKMCIRDSNIGGGKSIKLNEKSIGGPFGGASAEALSLIHL